MNKIKQVSRFLSFLFKGVAWFIPLIFAYFIFFNLESLIHWGVLGWVTPSNIQDFHFSLTHRFIILFIQFIPLSITIWICNKLSKLFGLYEKGELFEEENIQLIKSISILMIFGELVQFIYQPLITAALTFNNPVGERYAGISFGTNNLATLLTALIILVASWIVKEAQQLKRETQLTI